MANNKTINICFYHNEDLDGYACAAVVRKHHNDKKLNVCMYGVDYSVKDNLNHVNNVINKCLSDWKLLIDEDITIADIIICDYSFSPNVMKELAKSYNVVWIDHHESAINDAIANDYTFMAGIREVGIGACQLAYKYYLGSKNGKSDDTAIPNSIRALAKYDVFNFDVFEDDKGYLYDEDDIRNYQAYMNHKKQSYGLAIKAVDINDNDFYTAEALFFKDNINDARYSETGSLVRQFEENHHITNCLNNGVYRKILIGSTIVANNAFVVIGFFGSFDNACKADEFRSIATGRDKADLIINIIPGFVGSKIRIYTPNASVNAASIAKLFPNGGGHARVAGANISKYVSLPNDTIWLI